MAESISWVGDMLGRREEAHDLLLFLKGRLDERRRRSASASYVLNIDSGWGSGKTYFLSNIRSDLIADGNVVALVDAWTTDFSDDPLTVILSAIETAVKPHLHQSAIKSAWTGVLKSGGTLAISLTKHVGAKLLSKYAGDFGDELLDADLTAADNKSDPDPDDDALGLSGAAEDVVNKLADSALTRLMETFRKEERSISTFRKQLAQVSKLIGDREDGVNRPIYVLVDELDRCRPTYALRLLESVKHLFETDGVVFIIATDSKQLSESVKAVYGSNFDSRGYLRRFFDRTYRLREPSYESFVTYLFERSGISGDLVNTPSGLTAPKLASTILKDFSISLRDAEQCFDMLHTFCTMWKNKCKIEIAYALALICLYHSGRFDEYEIFSGKSNDPLSSRIIQHPSVILKTVGQSRFEAPNYETVYTTMDLLNRYHSVLNQSLVAATEQSFPSDPIGRDVVGALINEFSTVHGNRYNHSSPPYSILRTYWTYVELAERLSIGPA